MDSNGDGSLSSFFLIFNHVCSSFFFPSALPLLYAFSFYLPYNTQHFSSSQPRFLFFSFAPLCYISSFPFPYRSFHKHLPFLTIFTFTTHSSFLSLFPRSLSLQHSTSSFSHSPIKQTQPEPPSPNKTVTITLRRQRKGEAAIVLSQVTVCCFELRPPPFCLSAPRCLVSRREWAKERRGIN